MASETESVIALIVLGVIILVLSAILCTLCCLRHRQNPHRAEVMLNPDGDDTLAIGYRQEQERSRKYSMDPPKISRKSDFDDVHLDPSYTVSYVTDVEGNWEYFSAFVARTEGLYWGTRQPGELFERLELREGWRFIFGGDAVDKGHQVGGSLRFCHCVLSLKRRHPDRVTILLGNRDLNKMRLTAELHPGQLDPALLPLLPGPKWVPAGPKRVTPEQNLRKLVAAREQVEPAQVTEEQLAAHNTMANRLRYILKETMGADGELERRQAELTLLADRANLSSLIDHDLPVAPSGEGADVDRAVNSFIASVAIGGWMREWLEYGELGVVMGDTLFVHGGLLSTDYGPGGEDADAWGHVPGRAERIDKVHEWLLQLRKWKQECIQEWFHAPYWADPSPGGTLPADRRGGEALLDYCIPGQGPSVVMGRHLDADSMPMPAPYSLMARCNRSNITRLVVGHSPHGNCPTVSKTQDGERHLELVMNDTSYSDMKAPDNRGRAVSEFILYPSCNAKITGTLDDGAAYEYTLGADSGPADELVGRRELTMHAKRKKNGEPIIRFVKAKMTTGDYLLCHVNGYKYEYEYLTELDTVTAVGAVAAHDEIRISLQSHAMANQLPLRTNPLGASLSGSGGPLSSRNGARDWSTKIEPPLS